MSIYRIACCLLLLTLLPACKNDKTGLQDGDPTDFKEAVLINQYGITSIAISANNPILQSGHTQQYTVVGNTSTGGSVDISNDVRWSVSNSAAARIDENGLLTSLAQGDVTVSAHLSTYTDSADLRVTDGAAAGITITEADGSTDFTIDACKTLQLKAVASFTGETLTADVTDEVDWSTSLPTNAARFSTVSSEKGLLLTSSARNDIDVSATLDSQSASVTVTAQNGFSTFTTTPITVSSSTNSSSPVIASGGSDQFSASASFDDGSSADITRTAIWSSDNDLFATVGSEGLVSAHSVGNAGITASCGGQEQTVTVQVSSTNPISLAIDYDPASVRQTDAGGDILYLNVGDTLQLEAKAYYDNNTAPTTVTGDTTWEATPISGDASAATVANDGLVTANAVGSTLIKATYSGVDRSKTIIVQ